MRVEAVGAALRQLVSDGVIAEGRLLRLPAVPIVALQEAPLVGGVWLDRTVAELDVWGALIAAAGLTLAEDEDDTPLAWPLVEQQEGSPLPLPLHAQGLELRTMARARLARYRGRRQTIADRPYLQIEDYLAWRRRQRFDQAPAQEAGLPLAAWNAWVAAQKSLVGVPLAALAPWPSSARRAPYLDDEAAVTALAQRVRLLRELFGATQNAEETTRGREQARATLQALSDEVTLLRALTDATAQRWYASHAPLFPVVTQDLAALWEGVSHAAGLLARTSVDATGWGPAADCAARQRVTNATEDLARADGLWLTGGYDEAQAIVARVLAEGCSVL